MISDNVWYFVLNDDGSSLKNESELCLHDFVWSPLSPLGSPTVMSRSPRFWRLPSARDVCWWSKFDRSFLWKSKSIWAAKKYGSWWIKNDNQNLPHSNTKTINPLRFSTLLNLHWPLAIQHSEHCHKNDPLICTWCTSYTWPFSMADCHITRWYIHILYQSPMNIPPYLHIISIKPSYLYLSQSPISIYI